MKVKEFYENMKDIIEEPVTIMNGIVEEYSGFMKDKKIHEYLFECEIKSIYIGNNNSIVVDV